MIESAHVLGRVPRSRATKLALDELEQRYLGLMQISGEALLIVCDGLVVFSNVRACELLGVPRACEPNTLLFLDFIAPRDLASVQALLGSLKQPGQTSAFIRRELLRADRKPASVEVAMHACAYRGRPAIQVLMRDLGEQERLQEEVLRLVNLDPLTGLSNRRHFLELLDAAIDRAQGSGTVLGVVRMGLDNFRAINDAAGQHGGDIVMKQVAERLQSTWSPGATLARLGGDEFALILEGLDGPEGGAIAAYRLINSLAGSLCFEKADYCASVSIGIALYPLHAHRRDQLLCKALMAMKFAKSHGGNQLRMYSEELDLLQRADAQRRTQAALQLRTLTRREYEVLDLLVHGKATKMIAFLLGISARTIEYHRDSVMTKMQVDSLAELVRTTVGLIG